MEYSYITAWGKWRCELDKVTASNVQKAKNEGAPDDSVYFDRTDKRWVPISEIISPPCRKFLEEFKIKQRI